jgi:Histidine kinase-, DNA gyrase B-, and HSP90-like ATPase
MPAYRNALDAVTLDDVLSLDLDRGVASLDLARTAFVDAYALTGLACFVASAARDGLPVRVVLPEDPDVRSWLSRMHFGDVLEAFDVQVAGEMPRVVEHDRRDALIELQRFQDAHGSDRLASFVWERLEGGADGEVVNQLFEATGELGANVVEHADSPSGGFVTAQRYKAGTPDERIIVSVGDAGIGIRESLRPRYGEMTDDVAIGRAIRWHVSRVPDEGRGQGLPGVVEGVRGLGGTVWIRSGAALRTIARGRPTTVGVYRLQGTIVGARLPCRPGR